MSQHDEGEDLLLERLREATSGESSVRQLRRRYDLLRRDYEVLLDRLAELEERLATPAGTAPQPSAFEEQQPPAAAPEPAAEPPSARQNPLLEQLLAPLNQLQEEYRETIDALQTIADGLGSITQGVLKGQRGTTPPADTPEPRASTTRQVEVEVQSPGFGDLLDFQERLAGLPGVTRVSIHAIDSERATFAVELERQDP